MTTSNPLYTSIRIAARADEIFPYFTDPTLLVQWLGDWADLGPEPGGAFAVDIGNTPVRGEYVEVTRPHRIVFTWGVPGRDRLGPGSTTVEIVLTEDGPETLVELSHRGLPIDELESHLSGWTDKLGTLARLF